MVVTVTPNPSLDRTMDVAAFHRGGVVRAQAVHLDPGGKGVNVSRALVANGHASRAVLPLGGFEGDQLASLLLGLGIEVAPVRIANSIRSNVAVVEPDGTVTKLNAPGPSLSGSEVRALLEGARTAAGDGAGWVAGCGRLPPGAPDDLYARLVKAVRRAGVRVAVDTSGAALAKVLPAGPDLLKPNQDELAEVIGGVLETLGDVVAAAEKLRSHGVGAVLVSLGPDGAVLVDDAGAVHAESSTVVPSSTVGAGDALLAGFLATGGQGPEALAEGVAWGAAACVLPGTALPGPGDLHREEVRVQPIDPERSLKRGSDRHRPLSAGTAPSEEAHGGVPG
ncbi:MAG: 1-phosphofructokinase [Actinomycetota bacterium]